MLCIVIIGPRWLWLWYGGVAITAFDCTSDRGAIVPSNIMPPKNSKRNVEGGEASSGEEGGGASSPKRKRFISAEKDRKYESEDSMEDTKDSNDWGGESERDGELIIKSVDESLSSSEITHHLHYCH
ncbi:hypothetical protein Hamer_G023739 [Homarus americanus]|uniref:Uncharacterized protein n=1 Tax=Homarus americanus TaxID=6706 RepID=A0A8J5JN31_HOMAM|nr:hypothetical protein Hamer_G023739 [Homarus americanus]